MEAARALLVDLALHERKLRDFLFTLDQPTRSAIAKVLREEEEEDKEELVGTVHERQKTTRKMKVKKKTKKKEPVPAPLHEGGGCNHEPQHVEEPREDHEREQQSQEDDHFKRWYDTFKASAKERLSPDYKLRPIAPICSLTLFLAGQQLTLPRLQKYVGQAIRALDDAENLTMRSYYVFGMYWVSIRKRYDSDKKAKKKTLFTEKSTWREFVETFPFPDNKYRSYETVYRCCRLATQAGLSPMVMLGTTSVHMFFKYFRKFSELLNANAEERAFWEQKLPPRMEIDVVDTSIPNPFPERNEEKRKAMAKDLQKEEEP